MEKPPSKTNNDVFESVNPTIGWSTSKSGEKQVEVVVFDLDGTILDITERDAFSRYQALRWLGYNVSLDEVRDHYHYGIGRMGIVRELGITLAEKEIRDYFKMRFISFMERENALKLTGIHKGAYNILSVLSEEYQLVLATSRDELSSTEEELGWFNIRDVFNWVITREVAARYYGFGDLPLFPFQEQRTRLYECVIDLTNVPPNHMLCIGDTAEELKPANRLQMTTVGILTGMGCKEDLENCSQFVVQDLSQVKEILDGQ